MSRKTNVDASRVNMQAVVESWLKGLMHHMAQARLADQRVHERMAELRHLYQNVADDQLRVKIKVDYDLSDHFDSYNFHWKEVQRYAAAIQAVKSAYEFVADGVLV